MRAVVEGERNAGGVRERAGKLQCAGGVLVDRCK
jgi:hypothetical protein